MSVWYVFFAILIVVIAFLSEFVQVPPPHRRLFFFISSKFIFGLFLETIFAFALLIILRNHLLPELKNYFQGAYLMLFAPLYVTFINLQTPNVSIEIKSTNLPISLRVLLLLPLIPLALYKSSVDEKLDSFALAFALKQPKLDHQSALIAFRMSMAHNYGKSWADRLVIEAFKAEEISDKTQKSIVLLRLLAKLNGDERVASEVLKLVDTVRQAAATQNLVT
jgi:hypothetical protein